MEEETGTVTNGTITTYPSLLEVVVTLVGAAAEEVAGRVSMSFGVLGVVLVFGASGFVWGALEMAWPAFEDGVRRVRLPLTEGMVAREGVKGDGVLFWVGRLLGAIVGLFSVCLEHAVPRMGIAIRNGRVMTRILFRWLGAYRRNGGQKQGLVAEKV